MKVALSGRSTVLPGSSMPSVSADRNLQSTVGIEPWENLVLDCDSVDIFEVIMNHVNVGNIDKAVCVLK